MISLPLNLTACPIVRTWPTSLPYRMTALRRKRPFSIGSAESKGTDSIKRRSFRRDFPLSNLVR
jgi:hypothetical protein